MSPHCQYSVKDEEPLRPNCYSVLFKEREMKRILVTASLILLIVSGLTADESVDRETSFTFREKSDYFMKFRGSTSLVFTYYPAIHDGVNPGDNFGKQNYTPLDYTNTGDPGNNNHNDGIGRVINYTGSEVKLYAKYDFIAPFLNGDNFMIADNYIKLSLLGEISPVSLNVGASVTFQPLALLYLQSGFLIGPAWEFPGLAQGLALNKSGQEREVYSFWGPHMQVWFSATMQMDFAYVLPEAVQRWTHIVMYATPKFKYQALLSIPENVSYVYEADRGENMNGWRFMSEFFLGYQLPIIEDDTGQDRQFIKMRHKRTTLTTGMLVNIEKVDLTNYNDSPMASGGWGSDFVYVEFGPILKMDLPYNFWFILFGFFVNDKAYTDQTVGNIFYQDRVYEDWYVHFRRFGFFFGWDF
jgi:hypothetical protein